MVERQDIDALLISALYGELTPSEETRLAAHLDSHPGDRSALADLTHARSLVRESRLFQVQLEPPQSVSTLLMKEATRCAPKPEVQEGWFARFVRSFAAHPAMAAAAMLVIVLGVATFVTKRGGDQFAESTAPSSQAVVQTQDQAAQEKTAGDSPAAMGSGASESFRVALDEGKDAPGDSLADKKAENQKRDDVTVTKPTTERQYGSKLAKEQEEVAGATKKKPQGIELRAQQATPKDFDDASRSKGKAPEAKNELAFGDSDGFAPAPESAPKTGSSRGGEGAGGSVATGGVIGGAAPGTADNRRMDPSPAPAQQPTTTATASRPTTPRATTAPAPAPPPAAPKAEPRRDAPAKTVDRNATPRAAGPAEDKPADPQLAWARDQHNALIAQVRAGECKKAATIATAISNRAPAYYQQNVETDRSVKACIAYINSERERDAEQRSERARANQKRSVNEPAPTNADTTK